MGLAEPFGPLAVGEKVGGLVDPERHGGLEQRGLDPLPLAGLLPRLQRRQHANREIEAGPDIGDGQGNTIGRAILRPRHRHQAGHRLDHEVEAAAAGIRTGLAEAGDRTQHQSRVARMQRFPAQAQPLHNAGAKILQHHVGAVDQVPEDQEVVGVLEVEADAALVAVPQHEGGAFALDEGRRAAHGIALRAFDLDYVGAEVAELHAAERARQVGREIEDH